MKSLLSRVASLAFVAALAVGTSSAAFAWGPGHMNFTPEQQTKMQELSQKSYETVNPIMQQIHAKHAELNAEMYSATPNQAKIEKLSQELGSLQGKVRAEHANLNAKMVKEGLPAGAGMGHGMKGGMGHGMNGGMGHAMNGGMGYGMGGNK